MAEKPVDSEPTTTDALRHRIDTGQTGSKVAASDPALSPLGTDAEAGGVSPTKAEIKLAARQEMAGPKHAPDRNRSNHASAIFYASCIAAIGLVVALIAASA